MHFHYSFYITINNFIFIYLLLTLESNDFIIIIKKMLLF